MGIKEQKRGAEKLLKNEGENKIDWAKIRAEYVTGNMSLKKLADKYEVSHSALCKRSAKGRWSEERNKKQKQKAEKVADRLQKKEVRETVSNIDRLVNTAGKLLKQADAAIDELRKLELVSVTTTKMEQSKGSGKIEITKKNADVRVLEGCVNTKKLSEIAKSLVNIKQVFDGRPEDDDSGTGIVFLPTIEKPTPPEDENSGEIVIHDE